MRRLAFLPWLVGLIAFTAIPASPASKVDSNGSFNHAEEAVRQLQAGDVRGAAQTTRQALDADPGNTLLHNLAATLLIITGDTAGAGSEWSTVLNDIPGDSLATYGLGLVSLAHGDKAKALDRLQMAERSGDHAVCLISERYLESLSGAVGTGAGLVLPDTYAASAKGLSAIGAAKSGDFRRALTEIPEAMAALPGDPFAEPLGLVMTFDPGTPLRYGSPPLPTGNGLAGKRGQQANKPYSGVITLSPDQSGSDVGYVVFKIDGGLTSMANTQPFKYVWDTAKVPNGSHKVEIIVYDKAGQIMDRAQRDLRTSNADAPASQTQDQTARSEQIKSVLWQALTLRPSRHMLAFAGAEAARSAGDMASMQRYLEQAAALEPDYKDTRSRLNALNHCIAEPALWRGASNDPVVALTFDDGPKPGVTEMLLNVLTSEKVPATFFVIGRHATANPDLVKKISDAGMQIENHSYTHPNLTILPTAAVERELLKTIASVRSATGKHMRYFRPPGGNLNNEVTKAAAQWGLTPCMWTVDGESMENGTPDRLIEYVLQHAGPGAIILLHNGRMTTIEALPRIIEGLRKRGLGFVTIDQLAERKTRFGLRTTVTGRG